MGLYISIFGAISAIIVSLIGAWFANRNNIILQTRKLKEDHYVSYIEALHNVASDNNNKGFPAKYVFARDKLLLIASVDVVNKMLRYEEEAVGKHTGVIEKVTLLYRFCIVSILKSQYSNLFLLLPFDIAAYARPLPRRGSAAC